MIDEAAVTRILDRILDDEGGVKDAGDGAGVTRYGQTDVWLANWGFAPPKTRVDAYGNFRVFLALTKLDELTGIPDCEVLALATITAAINRTPSEAIRGLQAIVQCPQDGRLGPVTLASVMGADPTRLTVRYVLNRMRYYSRAVQQVPSELAFIAGWIDRQARLLETYFGIAN